VQAGVGAYHDFELSATALRAGIGKDTHRLFRDWAFQKELTLTEAMAHALRFPIPRLNRPRQQKICDLISRLQLLKAQTENLPLDKCLTHMAQASIIDGIVEEDPASRLAFQKLIELSKGLDIEPAQWLVSLNLDSDTDTIDTHAEKVSLMSMHAAKGLEFPVVFIAGCEDDFLPYGRSHDQGASSVSETENEERRLFYVAMTRAKEILFLCHARKRRVFGKMLERKVSPFLLDIEEKLIRKVVPDKVVEKIPKQKQLSLFKNTTEKKQRYGRKSNSTNETG
jgi:superfamily I DNA/RNA helicase